MSDVKGFGSSYLWVVAILVSITLLSLTGRGAFTIRAAEDPPPAADSASQAEKEESKGQQDSDDAQETSSNGSDEENVEEESDTEVEVEPEEKSSDEPPSEQDEDEPPPPKNKKRIIGATATVLEKQSGLLFRARVDTGAKSCSLHVEEMTIDDEEEKWVDNIGKVVRFRVKNGSDESHYLEGRIEGYVIIRTSDTRERRYKVPLVLRWKGVEKKVLVTLNNRNGMEYPLLLGRNFLRGDFLVDVEIDDD